MAIISVVCSFLGLLGGIVMVVMRHRFGQMASANAGLGSIGVGMYLLLWCTLCILGVLFGFVALYQRRGSRRAAWTGIVLGCLPSPFVLLGAGVLLGFHPWLRAGLFAASNLLLIFLMMLVLSRLVALQTGGMQRRSRMSFLLVLGLVNLTALTNALTYLGTDERIVCDDSFSDLVTNTRWQLVFVVLTISVLISAALYVLLLPSRDRFATKS